MLKSKKSRFLAAVVSMALVATVAVGATFAYLTDHDSKDNVFTFGNVTGEVSEPTWSGASDVTPDEVIAKDPMIVNTGKNDAYVRIKLTIPTFKDKDQNDVPYFLIGTTDAEGNFQEGVLGENWEYNKNDGYYYYTKIVYAGETGNVTTALFNKVKINPALKEGSTTSTLEQTLTVSADMIQADGFDTMEAAWAAFAAENNG